MCEAFTTSTPAPGITHVRPFVYVSAEDFHRPMISVRYMETKMEAERRIDEMTKDHPQYRAVHVRPCEHLPPLGYLKTLAYFNSYDI
jgi:hypothetical protein